MKPCIQAQTLRFTAALNRDIEGDNASTSQPPTTTDTTTALSQGTSHTPNDASRFFGFSDTIQPNRPQEEPSPQQPQATNMQQNADKNPGQNVTQAQEDKNQQEVNKPAGNQISIEQLLPIIEPQLDKDRAMRLQGLRVGLTSNNINQKEFVRHFRSLVGDHMLIWAAYKLQQMASMNQKAREEQEEKKAEAEKLQRADEVLKISNNAKFIKGAAVEVCNDEDGAWFSATILEQLSNGNYKIEYKSLRNDDDTALLTQVVDINHIRPRPPRESIEHFRWFEEVDALYNDGWWVAVVSKVLSRQRYEVFLRGTNEELVFEQSDLRRHLEWINGKWVSNASVCNLINKVEKPPDNLSSPAFCSKKRKVLDMMRDYKEKRKMNIAAMSDTRLSGDHEAAVTTKIKKPPDTHSSPVPQKRADDDRRLQDLANVALLDEQKPHTDRNEYVVRVNKMKKIVDRHKAKNHKLTNKLNWCRKKLKKKKEKLKAVVNTLKQREADISRLKEERRWLITEGIPRSFEVIRGSAEFRNAIAELAASADFVGWQDGMKDGIKLQQGGKRIEDHEWYKVDAEGDLVNTYQSLCDVSFPAMEEVVSTADNDDLDALKGLLASPVHDGLE